MVSLDCTKAFPSCRWDKLFGEMIMQLLTIVVRVIIYSYINQKAYVIWGDSVSDVFNIKNGTAEEKITSLAFWGIYILPLIKKLSKLGLGCHIGNMFVASIIFADDIILVSPNRKGAQLMLTTCETWAKENGITFSMDPCLTKCKTKVMWVTGTAKPRVVGR